MTIGKKKKVPETERLFQELMEAVKKAGCQDMTSGRFNVTVENVATGQWFETQGDLLERDYTWEDFLKWLISDLAEAGIRRIEFESIIFVSYAGPLESEDSDPTPAEYETYRKVQRYYRKEDAKSRVAERLAACHKEIFSRMADMGLNPKADERIQKLTRIIAILNDADISYLASEYEHREDSNCAANDMWESVIDFYIHDRLAALPVAV